MTSKPQSRADKTAHIIKYIDTDLLCYRTPGPKPLADLQHKSWQPWLDWFEAQYGQPLQVTTGLNALSQPEQAKVALEKEINEFDDNRFEAIYGTATVCGSVILGLAVIKEKLTPQSAINLIFLEEKFKETVYDADKYGADPHIEAKQKEALESLNHALTLIKP